MSGGVDSAIAAYLLKEQGYEVVAGFMKNYVSDTGNCTTYDDAQEAINASKFLWIEIISFDLQKEYNEKIIDYIFQGYQQWITPNPDILCNSLIKFDVFLQKALEVWFDYIATGHYARIEEMKQWSNSTYKLLRWIDHNKDQSYFLAGLNQFQLSKSLFPIGGYTKPEIRALAKKIGLPNAERKDSQWLCFIGNIPIRTFLEKKLPKKEGIIIDESGKTIGTHQWAWFFTIGQRRGLNLLPDHYVTKIDVKQNIVTVWPRWSELLNQEKIPVLDRHRIGETYPLPCEVSAKIRYRQTEPAPCRLEKNDKDEIIAIFQEKQRAIAPGQTLVAYNGEECIGSWIITNN